MDGFAVSERGQRTSTGAGFPTEAYDTLEEHGFQTKLDFKSATMALAADHMERWRTPATSAAEQAVKHDEIVCIFGRAYPEIVRHCFGTDAPPHRTTRTTGLGSAR